MAEEYIGLTVLFVMSIGLATIIVILTRVIGPRNPTYVKQQPFECGVDPLQKPHQRFSIKFYLTALLFIIFDIEVVFLYPWAVQVRELGLFGIIEMFVFISILFLALGYCWRMGAFDWE